MKNVIYKGEDVTEDDLYFVCFIIEKIARTLHLRYKDVVNTIGYNSLAVKISDANVEHCENPLQVVDDWIDMFNIKEGSFDITDVDKDLVDEIPSELEVARVYMRLIIGTLSDDEDYIQGLIRIYNDKICDLIDNYNCSAYYEPANVLLRAYYKGEF